jgi:putative hydrolase of the HAD superfamily
MTGKSAAMVGKVHDSVVVFDLDDTLYKEVEFVHSGLRFCAQELLRRGFVVSEAEVLALYQSNSSSVFQAIQELLLDTVRNPQESAVPELAELLGWYRLHKPKLVPCEEMVALLRWLESEGATLAIITDGRGVSQRNKISALGIDSFFANVFISEEVGHAKPDEYSHVQIERLYPGRQYLYVANDTKKDFVAPNSRGWLSIGLRDDGRNIHAQDMSLTANFLPQVWIDSLSQLSTLLKN